MSRFARPSAALKTLCVLTCLLFTSLSLYGQASTSRITGTVTDSTGASVPGAKVVATNEATGVNTNAATTQSGDYVIDALVTGTYTITVESAGFKKFVTKGNVLTIGQPATVNITLDVGNTTETVEVAERAELVQTSTAGNLGNQLSQRTIEALPIVGTRGRNPLELVLTQPGVVQGANTGGATIVNGSRDRAWNFTLDGIDANETSAGGANFSPIRTNPDSIAEFRVVTNSPTAELGRNSGANVAIVTRSGSNEYHGTAFWFYRTPELNANEWENNFNRLGKRMFVQNIYGGSIGGYVSIPKLYDGKNKTFWFLNIQRLAATESRAVNRLVYTASARQGLWRYTQGRQTGAFGSATPSVDASGNPLPNLNIATYNIAQNDPLRLGIDPTIANVISQSNMPLPNNFQIGDGLNIAGYAWAAPQNERQQDNTLKIDHVFNAKNAIFGRYSWGFQNTICDNGNTGLQLFPGEECIVNTQRDPRNWVLNYRWNPTARFTNELIFGQNYFSFDFVKPYGAINNNVLSGAPVTTRFGDFDLGNARKVNTWQLVDNAAYTFGKHNIRFGVNFRWSYHRDVRGSIAGENAAQLINFSRTLNVVDPARFNLPGSDLVAVDRIALESNINFLLGRVGRISRGFVAQDGRFTNDLYRFQAEYKEYDFYIQDNWKINRRLTMDIGLRWEIKEAPSDDSGEIRAPNSPLVFGAAPTNQARWVKGDVFRTDWNNLGPTIGLAYDPFGKGKTVIRSSFRIAYDRLNSQVLSTNLFQNLPGRTLAAENVTFGAQGDGRLRNVPNLTAPTADPESFTQPGAFSNNSILVMDPNFKTPTTLMWGFGIEQELPYRFVFSADYIGRRAYNLIGAYNANQVDIFSTGFLDAVTATRTSGESALLDRITTGDTRRRANETGAAFIRRQFVADLNQGGIAAIANSLAQQAPGANFFRRFPQFNAVNVIDSNDFSTYNALQTQVQRRFYNGLALQFAYTWAKALDTRSFDPTFTIVGTGSAQSASSTPFDIANRKLNYARNDSDYRHAFQSYAVYELPFGRGRKFFNNAPRALDYAFGGWQVTSILRRLSGRPFTIFSGVNTFNNVVSSTANCTGCTPGMGEVFTQTQATVAARNGFEWFLTEPQLGQFSIPGAGQQGNTPRNFFDTAWRTTLDMSIAKRIKWGESESRFIEIRADGTNIPNVPIWGIPTATVTSALFGRLGTPTTDNSRKFQLAAKFNF